MHDIDLHRGQPGRRVSVDSRQSQEIGLGAKNLKIELKYTSLGSGDVRLMSCSIDALLCCRCNALQANSYPLPRSLNADQRTHHPP